MIQPQTLVQIVDNTGGKVGRVFKVIGGTRRRYARLGDIVIVAVQVAEPRKAVKKKDIAHAVVVRQRQPYRRNDGSYIRFDENSVVLIETGAKNYGEPRGNRVFGPIPRELVERGFRTITSLAPEIV